MAKFDELRQHVATVRRQFSAAIINAKNFRGE
jgi:hypothetical protein